jgi:hypothetical protein
MEHGSHATGITVPQLAPGMVKSLATCMMSFRDPVAMTWRTKLKNTRHFVRKVVSYGFMHCLVSRIVPLAEPWGILNETLEQLHRIRLNPLCHGGAGVMTAGLLHST